MEELIMIEIELKEVGKYFGGNRILSNISFDVHNVNVNEFLYHLLLNLFTSSDNEKVYHFVIFDTQKVYHFILNMGKHLHWYFPEYAY